MPRARAGFSLIEAAVSVVLMLVLSVVLLPAAAGARQPSGLAVSLQNVQRIIQAHWDYRDDNADQVPMRGARYSNGQLSGWDSWVIGGNNPRMDWAVPNGGLFDESAFSRPL